jgi:hypothetical protein
MRLKLNVSYRISDRTLLRSLETQRQLCDGLNGMATDIHRLVCRIRVHIPMTASRRCRSLFHNCGSRRNIRQLKRYFTRSAFFRSRQNISQTTATQIYCYKVKYSTKYKFVLQSDYNYLNILLHLACCKYDLP